MYCLVSYYSSYKQSVEELLDNFWKIQSFLQHGRRIMNCSWQQSSLVNSDSKHELEWNKLLTSVVQALLGVGSSSPRCPGRGQGSVQLVPLFQPVTGWAAELTLGWSCRPAAMQEIFLVVAVDEPSALTSSGLATTASRWLHLLPFPCFKMWQQHVVPTSSESILMLN